MCIRDRPWTTRISFPILLLPEGTLCAGFLSTVHSFLVFLSPQRASRFWILFLHVLYFYSHSRSKRYPVSLFPYRVVWCIRSDWKVAKYNWKFVYLIWTDPSEPYVQGISIFSFGKPFPDLPDPCTALLWVYALSLIHICPNLRQGK